MAGLMYPGGNRKYKVIWVATNGNSARPRATYSYISNKRSDSIHVTPASVSDLYTPVYYQEIRLQAYSSDNNIRVYSNGECYVYSGSILVKKNPGDLIANLNRYDLTGVSIYVKE